MLVSAVKISASLEIILSLTWTFTGNLKNTEFNSVKDKKILHYFFVLLKNSLTTEKDIGVKRYEETRS